MERADVVIVGAGPAGSTCAILCAAAGLRTVVLEREAFPREKVCGDCLNPGCWPILRGLGADAAIRGLSHVQLRGVEFIAISGARAVVQLSKQDDPPIAIKRSLFDYALMQRARAVGATVLEQALVTRVEKMRWGDWTLDATCDKITAPILVAADGRNSTIARLRNLLPRGQRERVALQAHVPLPAVFGNRVVLQFLGNGYSGQAAVNGDELNLCLAGKPAEVDRLKQWAAREFRLSMNQPWRTITPLARPPLGPIEDNLFLIGDAARIVEPFTGEGIYYALRSAEVAAEAIIAIVRGEDHNLAVRRFASKHREMYRGRLWINHLARIGVTWPHLGSAFVRMAQIHTGPLRFMTRKIALE